jgi:phosphomannomutase
LRQGLLAGLAPFGFRLVDLGVVPTPTAQFYMEPTEATGAMVITASHNPAQWNGFKFMLGPERTVLDAGQTEALIQGVREVGDPPAEFHAPEAEDQHERAVRMHLDRVLEQVDPEVVRRAGFKVAVDSAGGAGVEPTLRLLEALGCQVVQVQAERDSEPLPENLAALCAAVKEHGCHLGMAQDLDADRLALISEEGEPLGDEFTLVLAVEHLLERWRGRNVAVVRNVATTRAVDAVARVFGARIVETRVGEVNLSRALARERAGGAVAFGGEGNGGVILPQVALGRDSLTGIALVLEILAHRGQPLSQVVASLPAVPMAKLKVPLSDGTRLEDCYSRIRELFPQAVADCPDGLRLTMADGGWVLVRPSNTEPIARIVVQSGDAAWVERTLPQVLEAFKRG